MNAKARAPGLLWWRLTLSKDGGILTCEQADAVEKNGQLTCYVQATSKPEACSRAKEWYANRRALANANKQARQARAAAAGLCIECRTKPSEEGRPRCQQCRERNNQTAARARARKAGQDVPLLVKRHETPEAARAAILKTQRESKARTGAAAKERAAGRLCRLRGHIVLDHFDRLGPERFRAWLVDRIEESKQ